MRTVMDEQVIESAVDTHADLFFLLMVLNSLNFSCALFMLLV